LTADIAVDVAIGDSEVVAVVELNWGLHLGGCLSRSDLNLMA
jgi:hypothetical protein